MIIVFFDIIFVEYIVGRKRKSQTIYLFNSIMDNNSESINNTESVKEILKKILFTQIQFIEVTSDIQKQSLQHFANLLDSTPETNSKVYENGVTRINEPFLSDFAKKDFNLYDYYSLTRRDDVLISYKGPVTDVILSEISRDIRNKFAETPRLSKKLFAIFIELAQNILYYSSEKINFSDRRDSVGTLLVTRIENKHLNFACGNLVENKYVDGLVESCEMINSLNREELREYKRVTRSAPRKERSKGAGIGLIQVALTSGNPLEVEVRQVDEGFSFFSISVRVNC